MTLENAHYINMVLGLGAIVVQILCVLALIFLCFRPKENIYLSFVKKYFLQIGFLLSVSAVLASLFFSEVMQWIPCFHCWIDRILIFPQAVIFGIAWWKKDRNAFLYSLVLTVLGLVNSLYHLYIYYFGEGLAPCDASGVSCMQRYVNEFGGYISIPTLAFTGFFALLILLLVAYFYKKED